MYTYIEDKQTKKRSILLYTYIDNNNMCAYINRVNIIYTLHVIVILKYNIFL